jgi:hypothetical protein
MALTLYEQQPTTLPKYSGSLFGKGEKMFSALESSLFLDFR